MTRTLRVVAGDAIDGDPLPHSIPAEQAVLGAVMLSPAVLGEVRAVLDGSEFYRPAHALVWETVTALADRGDPHDPLTVGARLGKDIARAGGAPYLHTLIASVPGVANAAYYAHIIRDLAYARDVLAASHRLTEAAWQASGDPESELRATVAAEAAALAQAGRRGWPDPVLLSATPEVPPFPVWALPGWLGEYAASVAEVTQTPPDLAGCLALAVLSVAASGKVWIAPTADPDGWREPACLYLVIAMPPGSRKSEVFRAMTVPLRAVEKSLIQAARPRIAEALIRRKIAEAAAEKTAREAETAAAQVDPDRKVTALAEATEARIELDNAEIPAEPCLFATDTTIEKLGARLAEQGGRFAVLSPEGEIFSIAAGRYSGAPNLGDLKSAHAGEAIRTERMGRTAHIEQATLTIGVCTQPGVLTRFGDTPEFREQGLLARLLYSVPGSLLGWRNPSPDPIQPAARDLYVSTLTALTLSLDALTEPRTVTFTPDAARAVTRLLGDIEPRFRTVGEDGKPGDLAHMTDWGGKLAGAIIRIAGLIHLAQHARDGWDRPITRQTLDTAVQLGDYYTGHAKAAYDTIGADPATAHARAILQYLHTTRPAQISARDLMRALRGRFSKASDAAAPLAILESHGWIRQRPAAPAQGRGRPAAPTWDVHPGIAAQP
jgi:replicative DNA helicase